MLARPRGVVLTSSKVPPVPELVDGCTILYYAGYRYRDRVSIDSHQRFDKILSFDKILRFTFKGFINGLNVVD